MTQIDKLRHYWHYFKMDTPLFLMLMGISIFGLTILYSASAESISLVYKQMLHFALAISMMLIIAQIPPYIFRRYSPYLMLLGIFLLLLVLLFGSSSGGAQRWLDMGFMRFQPSELMKVIVPIAIASILSEKTLPPQPVSIFTSLSAIIVIVLLIAKQPDLGTSLLIGASGIYVLILSGVRIQILRNNFLNLGVIGAGVIGSGYVAWNYLLIGYQKKRILTMIDPTLDPLGAGYHILQSKIAIGSGGLLGKGFEQGSQAQLNFLPEHSTDFIFAVIAEELGFIGVLLLLCFYGLIVWRCFVIAIESEDTFSKLLGASLTLIFFTYIFVNIGMVSGLLPVVGVPLPLISYGGSSLITLFASFGIIMSIRKHKAPSYLS
ncbi:rod shape-determining protein RodA [Bathymodiolus septemdierum thioautotrophic gill symbiont]|uniref:Peptidoglycan glycosyltransferase MrdB n=1 Tax=endosymbiont of Bathymodiolus septemdierum str. Myojin knoll TaxID=1303921 RepID=A0A0P0UR85_9GAMM|nr:rod shape-determining protein RodA [Bathymodiolus septemdierum thioautotrophic gill symbiont]BAS67552.1 rod shape determining protein RodA [endosymbiont of Bathymodiolus septemdierum str. Myojin knoll]